MEQVTNQIRIRGTLQNLPEFSHENHGHRFFRFSLEVPRLSGAVDALPVIAEEALLNRGDEVGQLAAAYRDMLDTIADLIDKNYVQQLTIKDTQYRSLQAQLNPHFIYNTLVHLGVRNKNTLFITF